MCFSPHSANGHFCALCIEHRNETASVLTPGDLIYWCHGATDVDRPQVSFQDCWEGKGEPKETSQKNGHWSWILEEWTEVGEIRLHMQAGLELTM